jgi:hypothetical protein
MSYKKNVNPKKVSWGERVIIISVMILAIGTVAYGLSKSNEPKKPAFVAQETEGGIVASSINPQLQSPQSTNNAQVQSAQDTNPIAEKTYPNFEVNLPAGWTKKSEETVDNPCDGLEGKKLTTAVYVNGQEELTIYENGSPNGCGEGSAVADVYLDFDYTSDNSYVLVKTDNVVFCDLSVPNCPKGDGKVSLFIGNKDDADKDIVNPDTKDSYFFSIVDTKLDSDTNAQAATLAKIVESIIIK